MLLTIHNLPLNTQHDDVKVLLLATCGLNDMIIDQLVPDGAGMKVTVGLAEEEEANMILTRVNGLHYNGRPLMVKDARQKRKHSEEPCNPTFKKVTPFQHDQTIHQKLTFKSSGTMPQNTVIPKMSTMSQMSRTENSSAIQSLTMPQSSMTPQITPVAPPINPPRQILQHSPGLNTHGAQTHTSPTMLYSATQGISNPYALGQNQTPPPQPVPSPYDQNKQLYPDFNQPINQINPQYSVSHQQYGQPNQQYAQPNQQYVQPNQHVQPPQQNGQLYQQYAQPNQPYVQPNQHVQLTQQNGQLDQQYAQPNQQYVQPNQHVQLTQQNEQPDQQYAQPNQQYVQPNQHVQLTQQNEQPDQQYWQPSQQYVQPNKQHMQPNQQTGQQNLQYGQLNQQYVQPNQQYVQPNQQYEQPNQQYGLPNQQYMQLNQQTGQPNQQYGQPNQQYVPPNQQHSQPIQQFNQPRQAGLSSLQPQQPLFNVNLNCVNAINEPGPSNNCSIYSNKDQELGRWDNPKPMKKSKRKVLLPNPLHIRPVIVTNLVPRTTKNNQNQDQNVNKPIQNPITKVSEEVKRPSENIPRRDNLKDLTQTSVDLKSTEKELQETPNEKLTKLTSGVKEGATTVTVVANRSKHYHLNLTGNVRDLVFDVWRRANENTLTTCPVKLFFWREILVRMIGIKGGRLLERPEMMRRYRALYTEDDDLKYYLSIKKHYQDNGDLPKFEFESKDLNNGEQFQIKWMTNAIKNLTSPKKEPPLPTNSKKECDPELRKEWQFVPCYLRPPLRNILLKEIQNIGFLLKKVWRLTINSQQGDNVMTDVCLHLHRSGFIDYAKQMIASHITKRLLNEKSGPKIKIQGPTLPQREDMEAFLRPYNYSSLKVLKPTDTFAVATFDDFKYSDELAAMKTAIIGQPPNATKVDFTYVSHKRHLLEIHKAIKLRISQMTKSYIERQIEHSEVDLLDKNWPAQMEKERNDKVNVKLEVDDVYDDIETSDDIKESCVEGKGGCIESNENHERNIVKEEFGVPSGVDTRNSNDIKQQDRVENVKIEYNQCVKVEIGADEKDNQNDGEEVENWDEENYDNEEKMRNYGENFGNSEETHIDKEHNVDNDGKTFKNYEGIGKYGENVGRNEEIGTAGKVRHFDERCNGNENHRIDDNDCQTGNFRPKDNYMNKPQEYNEGEDLNEDWDISTKNIYWGDYQRDENEEDLDNIEKNEEDSDEKDVDFQNIDLGNIDEDDLEDY